MDTEFDLLQVRKGSITAPAGCGKTQLIADALKRHNGKKPVLVLTHTNAGVAALRARLNRAQVHPSNFSLSTIDGWSMKLVSTFPRRAKVDLEILKIENPKFDYPAIREAAALLLHGNDIRDILSASYACLIVDEYQDCSALQHNIISLAGEILPVCVLGDPLQAIFGFPGNQLAHWQNDVCAAFPHRGELTIPWRWKNAGTDDLGYWLLEARKPLLTGKRIDLGAAPSSVAWVELEGKPTDFERTLQAAGVKPLSNHDNILIIGDSVNADSRHKIASSVHGAVIVETVDLKDLVLFARTLDFKSASLLSQVVNFAQSLMTNIGGADLLKRVQSLKNNTAHKSPTPVEEVALHLVRYPSYKLVADLLEEMNKETAVRAFRPAVLKACYRALNLVKTDSSISFHDAVVRIREQQRAVGRHLPRRAVGSTLLLKGLEAESAVILNADSLDAKNLYVAMTRGSKSLTICSRSKILQPRP